MKLRTEKESKIAIRSSNKCLQEAFEWAVNKIRQFIMTGKAGLVNRDEFHPDGDGSGEHVYVPSYWAGYHDRTAFYSRDFVHQALGAQIAGYTEENYNMFRIFAGGATKEREWYTPWAFNFDGTPHTIDYKNDQYFVREVPAQFELVEMAYKMYLWSGDKRYLTDPVLYEFYTKVLTEFVELHDGNQNGIAEGTGGGIFEGTCSYNERSGEPLLESGDALGAQYQAMRAYAGILENTGKIKESETWAKKAEDLKKYFNDVWSRCEKMESSYVRAWGIHGEKYSDFASENTWFMPLKMITEPGKRNDKYIDFILENLGEGIGTRPLAPVNLESYTYIPDMLFLYNRNDEAWKWMKYIISRKDLPHERAEQGTNGDYPEIAFTMISQVVEGMMGIEPEAGKGIVATLPRLPGDVRELLAENIQIGEWYFNLQHERNKKSILTNYGDKPILWEVRFYGTYKFIRVDGVPVATMQKKINGETVSYTRIKVFPGKSAEAVIL
ncbi:MAG: hypothetical protein ACI4TF_04735 [Oliverpabstia sp.]